MGFTASICASLDAYESAMRTLRCANNLEPKKYGAQLVEHKKKHCKVNPKKRRR